MKFPLARKHRGVGDNNLRGYFRKQSDLDQGTKFTDIGKMRAKQVNARRF